MKMEGVVESRADWVSSAQAWFLGEYPGRIIVCIIMGFHTFKV